MWKTAERSEEFSKPCENPRVGNPEQICKALNGLHRAAVSIAFLPLVLRSRQTLSHGTSCELQAMGVVNEPV